MSRKGTIAPTDKTRGSTSVRARILDAAITEFAANGFSGGRIDRIAQSAVVNRAMLYYYYADKQELFHLAVCSAVAALLETADWDDAQPLKSLSRSWQLAHADPRNCALFNGRGSSPTAPCCRSPTSFGNDSHRLPASFPRTIRTPVRKPGV